LHELSFYLCRFDAGIISEAKHRQITGSDPASRELPTGSDEQEAIDELVPDFDGTRYVPI